MLRILARRGSRCLFCQAEQSGKHLKTGEDFLRDVGEKGRGFIKRGISATSRSWWASAQPTVYEKVCVCNLVSQDGMHNLWFNLFG